MKILFCTEFSSKEFLEIDLKYINIKINRIELCKSSCENTCKKAAGMFEK